jgi:hypothetical protein
MGAGTVLLVALLGVVLGPLASARAQGTEHADPPALEERSGGGYVGIGGHAAFENFDIPGRQDDAAGLVFRGGFRAYEWLAIELLGEILSTFEDDSSRRNDVTGFSVTFSAKLIAPLGRVEPWAMAGLGFLGVDEDRRGGRRDDLALRPAAGVDVYITPHWAVYGEAAYMLPTGDVRDYHYGSIGGGILYCF